MKNTRNLLKKEKTIKNLNKQNRANTNNDMTIEEARETERAFNEELRIFKEAAAMNRTREEN